MRQLLAGMDKLHVAGIMHRDLKPENLLYSSREPDAHIKIADFGLGCFYNDIFSVHDMCGTPLYMAPELVLSGESCFFDGNGMPLRVLRTYGPAIDVWSCGAILYQLLCGYCPFQPVWCEGADGNWGWDIDIMYEKICKCDYSFPQKEWASISKDCLLYTSDAADDTPC
eukprot:5795549-Pleurochrysis_carterae.AAC.1